MMAKPKCEVTLSVRVIRADGTIEDKGMIFSTKKSDREKNKEE